MSHINLELGHVNHILRQFEKVKDMDKVDLLKALDSLESGEARELTAQFLEYEINSCDLTKLLFSFSKELLGNEVQYGFIKEEHNNRNTEIANIGFKKATAKIGERTLSGLIINPYLGNQKSIFLYMHGTRLKKSPTPSSLCEKVNEFSEDLIELMRFKWTTVELINLIVALFEKGSNLLDYIEELFLIMIAVLKGCIVIIPDYPGLGDDIKTEHPYVVAKNLKQDLCAFTEQVINNPELLDKRKDWNGDLNIGGYSQGGYVAMVVAAGLIERESFRNHMKNVWPASGPYSLSTAMRKIMVSKEFYPNLSILPLTIRAFYECCGKKEFLSPEYAFGKNGDKIFDVVIDSTDIKESDQTLKEYAIGKSIPYLLLTNSFINMLDDENSEVSNLLKKNDAFQTYPPKLSNITTLFHHKEDNVVPYENAVIASKVLNLDIVDLKLLFLDDILENKHILAFISYITKILYI